MPDERGERKFSLARKGGITQGDLRVGKLRVEADHLLRDDAIVDQVVPKMADLHGTCLATPI